MPEAQAVAVAIKHCAPDKSTSRAAAEAPSYRAQQAADGSWTIFNVPIFAVHTDERLGKPIKFDVKWLRKALKRGQTRHGEGYYPPLHISHHGEADVEAAGRVRLTEIRTHPHGGEQIPTLFADLVGVRPEIYQRIRRGELSYRSVEILDVDSPEIDSLALLDDEVPYFRFPLLKIGSEKQAKRSPALAYSAAGSMARVLFSFEEPMKKQDDEEKVEVEAEIEKQDEPSWAAAMFRILNAISRKLNVDLDEEEEIKDKESAAAAEMAAQPAAPLEVGVAEAMRSEAAQDTMSASVAELQREIGELKTQRRVEARAAQLKERGFSADHVGKYRAIATEKGEVAARYWADAMEEHRPAEPPANFTGELAPPHTGVDSEAVRKYNKSGPEALELARSIARSYAATNPDMSLEEYLEINMDTEGYFAASRAGAGRSN